MQLLVLRGQNCTFSAFSLKRKQVQQAEAGLELHLVAIDGEGASEQAMKAMVLDGVGIERIVHAMECGGDRSGLR
ncbi:hypothetical protein N9T98_00010 [bacterium]|nr:hypothetical protein [bacterium]